MQSHVNAEKIRRSWIGVTFPSGTVIWYRPIMVSPGSQVRVTHAETGHASAIAWDTLMAGLAHGSVVLQDRRD